MRHTQASDPMYDLANALLNPDLVRIKGEILKAKNAGRLDKGLPPLCTDTALTYALEHNRPALWPLIQAGADVNAQDYKLKQTPLFKTNKPALMQMLIKAGANVDAQDCHKQTPLHVARSRQAINVLIRAGAQVDVDAVDEYEWPPFMRMIARNEINIVKLMLAIRPALVHKKSTNYKISALHCANTRKMAQLLLDAGADLNPIDAIGETPLHYSRKRKIAQFLLDRGANPNATNHRGSTPLHVIIRGYYRTIGIVKTLAPKTNLEMYDEYGFTPLHRTAYNTKKELKYTQILINAGANLRVQVKESSSSFYRNDDKNDVVINEVGNIPLHLAAISGNIEIAQLLLRYTRPPKPCAAMEPQAVKGVRISSV